jgi:integrase
MKEPKGYVFMRNGEPYARLQFVDSKGKKRDLWRKCKSRIHAKQVLKDLSRELNNNGIQSIDASRMTFIQLCDHYESRYVHAAEYVQGRKVAGFRSLKTVVMMIRVLREYFGTQFVQSITYGDLEAYKRIRLKTPSNRGGQRSIATVNRELARLRRILTIAARERWISRNPFEAGDSLICLANERKRERILTRDEESRLVATCVGRRAHLRPIIIAALDTGCRLGELRQMRWRDIDFDSSVVTIQAFNTKTLRERQVSLTTRLRLELEMLTRGQADDLVFGFRDSVKRSFNSARKEADLCDVRFHDLRHTHASRLDALGFSLAKIGHQLGHTQVQTTLRYVNRDKAGVRQVAVALDAFNGQSNETDHVSAAVN